MATVTHYLIACLWRMALALMLAVPPVTAWGARGHAAPQGETPWVESFRSQVRMIAGAPPQDGGKQLRLAGIQLRLDPGWKTYWRSPGDAGLPPSFDWSGSRNLKSARVLWPAPKRFADPYGTSVGYQDEIVFPVLVDPADAGRAVDLAVKFSFAVCKDICAPAEAALRLAVPAQGTSSTRHAELLSGYVRRVPGQAAKGEKAPKLAELKIDLAPPKPSITVETLFPDGAADADLFVEGPEGFYLPLAERVGADQDGRVRFMVDLTKGDDPSGLKGKALTFTLVSRDGLAEIKRSVD